MIIMDAKIFLKSQDTLEMGKEIKKEEVNQILETLSTQFDINITEIITKIALHKTDGFSINKNNPYTNLHIGNGSENISVDLTTLEKEMKMKIPKSFFIR